MAGVYSFWECACWFCFLPKHDCNHALAGSLTTHLNGIHTAEPLLFLSYFLSFSLLLFSIFGSSLLVFALFMLPATIYEVHSPCSLVNIPCSRTQGKCSLFTWNGGHSTEARNLFYFGLIIYFSKVLHVVVRGRPLIIWRHGADFCEPFFFSGTLWIKFLSFWEALSRKKIFRGKKKLPKEFQGKNKFISKIFSGLPDD